MLPPGTTYVPGSLRVVDGPNPGVKTDRAGDDQGAYDAASDTVVFRLGTGASASQGGSLANTAALPEGTTVEYRVVLGLETAGTRVVNTAVAAYENRLGATPEPLTSTSDEAVTEVRPAADLDVVKAADATTVTVGQTVTYRLTVHNAGPSPATGVTVVDRLPDGLVFLSAEASAGAHVPETGQWSVGELAVGARATLVLRAKATRAARPTNTATVTAVEKDPDPSDNTDSVVVCVEPAPACCAPCVPRS